VHGRPLDITHVTHQHTCHTWVLFAGMGPIDVSQAGVLGGSAQSLGGTDSLSTMQAPDPAAFVPQAGGPTNGSVFPTEKRNDDTMATHKTTRHVSVALVCKQAVPGSCQPMYLAKSTKPAWMVRAVSSRQHTTGSSPPEIIAHYPRSAKITASSLDTVATPVNKGLPYGGGGGGGRLAALRMEVAAQSSPLLIDRATMMALLERAESGSGTPEEKAQQQAPGRFMSPNTFAKQVVDGILSSDEEDSLVIAEDDSEASPGATPSFARRQSEEVGANSEELITLEPEPEPELEREAEPEQRLKPVAGTPVQDGADVCVDGPDLELGKGQHEETAEVMSDGEIMSEISSHYSDSDGGVPSAKLRAPVLQERSLSQTELETIVQQYQDQQAREAAKSGHAPQPSSMDTAALCDLDHREMAARRIQEWLRQDVPRSQSAAADELRSDFTAVDTMEYFRARGGWTPEAEGQDPHTAEAVRLRLSEGGDDVVQTELGVEDSASGLLALQGLIGEANECVSPQFRTCCV
jgi:hypothetical protein